MLDHKLKYVAPAFSTLFLVSCGDEVYQTITEELK
jgi:hypothetical protein